MQFDNDKTLSIAELEKEYPNINWHSKAGLTIRSISAAFRMYEKEMPEIGPCLRSEINHSSKSSKKITDTIKEIRSGTGEETPDEFIAKARKKKK